MSIVIKTKYWILLAFALLVLTFSSGLYFGCKRQDRSLQAQLQARDSVILQYKVKLHGVETTAYQSQQIITTQNAAIRAGEIERKELRALHLKDVNEISRLKLRIDTLLDDVSHNGQIIDILDSQIANLKPAKDSTTKQKAILLPFSFNKTDKWLHLDGVFNNQGRLDISLVLDADLNVYTGTDKKTKLPICTVTSDNLYLGVLSIKSFKFDKQKPKPWGVGFHIGYGAVLGDANKVRLSPYIGAGVSYSIIRF